MPPAVLRHVGDAERDRSRRRRDADRLAVEGDLARVGRRQAEQVARELRAARSHQAGEPEDLAARGRVSETSRTPARGARQVAHLEHGVAERDTAASGTPRTVRGRPSAESARRESTSATAPRRRPSGRRAARSRGRRSRRSPRGGGRCKSRRRPAARAGADDAEQRFDFALGERRGRLVHDARPGRRPPRAFAISTICCSGMLSVSATGAPGSIVAPTRASSRRARARAGRPVDPPPGAARLRAPARCSPPTVRSGKSDGCW